ASSNAPETCAPRWCCFRSCSYSSSGPSSSRACSGEPGMNDTDKQLASRGNSRSMWRLLVVVAAMFGFGFVLIPLYDVFCEVTGINVLTKKDDAAASFARNTQVDTGRS